MTKLLPYHRDHAFCPETGYCKKCGQAERDLKEGYTTPLNGCFARCPGGGNVVAISHIVHARRLEEWLNALPETADVPVEGLGCSQIVVDDPFYGPAS